MQNFQSIPKVETADTLIDIAFRRAKTRVEYFRQKKFSKDRAVRAKQFEIVRVEVVKDQLVKRLNQILEAFPIYSELHPFYQELVKCTIDYHQWKQSLGAVLWALRNIRSLGRQFILRLRKCSDMDQPKALRNQFYGRVASIVKQINKDLLILDECRKSFRRYPVIKTGIPTIVIAGFPNVGKTTLLSKLTGASAEIQAYAFTTRKINLGYVTGEKEEKRKKRKLQILDVPGTLNRFNKMNNIEKQAHLCLKYLAQEIIYVFDPTESFPMDQQIALYKKIKKDFPDIPIIAFLSKRDLVKNYKGPAMEFKPIKLTALKKKLEF